MERGKHDKRWLRINVYIDIETGEVLGNTKPKNYNNVTEISKKYNENENFRIIERTIGCRAYGEQQQLQFREYNIQ